MYFQTMLIFDFENDFQRDAPNETKVPNGNDSRMAFPATFDASSSKRRVIFSQFEVNS